MALEAKDINNVADMQRYVEGCLNDLVEGISTVDETMQYMQEYTFRVIDIAVGENEKPVDIVLNMPPKSVRKATLVIEDNGQSDK